MKTFIDYFLSKTIQKIEKHENNYQRCVETYMGELAKIISGSRKTTESDLKNLDLIDLTFSLNENPDWNYLLQPHEIQGLKIVHFEPKVFDSSKIECLFGTLSFKETNLEKIFENTKKRRPKQLCQNCVFRSLGLRQTPQLITKKYQKQKGKFVNGITLQLFKAPRTQFVMIWEYLKFRCL